MLKKYYALLAAGIAALTLAACGVGPADPGADGSSAGEPAGLTEAFTQPPSLVTSGGQSADYQMVGAVMDKLEMDCTINNLAEADDLGEAKTLIVVVGGSAKGLTAAGIEAEDELDRLEELLDGAEEDGLGIIAMHIGGSARRGELSDQFIDAVFPRADYAIVVSSGDEDGRMAGICAENDIPMDTVSRISDVAAVLPEAFLQEDTE